VFDDFGQRHDWVADDSDADGDADGVHGKYRGDGDEFTFGESHCCGDDFRACHGDRREHGGSDSWDDDFWDWNSWGRNGCECGESDGVHFERAGICDELGVDAGVWLGGGDIGLGDGNSVERDVDCEFDGAPADSDECERDRDAIWDGDRNDDYAGGEGGGMDAGAENVASGHL
jgi:hypothetical protein